MVLFLIVFAWFVFYMPNYLGHADNYNEGQSAGDAGAHRAGMVPAAVLRDPARHPEQADRRHRDVRLDRRAVPACRGSTRRACARPSTGRSTSSSSGFSSSSAIGLGYLGSQPPEGRLRDRRAHPDRLLLHPLPGRSCRCSACSRRRGRDRLRSPRRCLVGGRAAAGSRRAAPPRPRRAADGRRGTTP